jgi:predicted nucleic acid-binding Zn ribbon protein
MKQKPTEIHKYYNVFGKELKTSVVQQYSRIAKEWKFFGYRCLHCDSPFKSVKKIEQHKTVCKEINTIKKEKEMPIQVVTIKGERYYKWGDSGKPYKNRADAEKQAAAAYASGYKEKKDMNKK